ncbi:MAG TPA: hypothetical protein VIW27_07780 [Gammaproteobacteria bacterium]|jgi:heme/copper-type cytochrome/quinol oxidase subunit 2
MTGSDKNLWQSLGFLRLALLALALLNALLPLVAILTDIGAGEHGLWNLLVTMITPVMAPLFVVVLLFDYIMSRVRAADAEGERRLSYTRIARIELAVILLTLVFWVSFFIELMS